jgi:putative ABC transport system ATP-binding protein
MGLIEIKDVSKEYRIGEVVVRALQHINMEIDEKAFVSVIGPSGSGKTTLLNLIGCLE